MQISWYMGHLNADHTSITVCGGGPGIAIALAELVEINDKHGKTHR